MAFLWGIGDYLSSKSEIEYRNDERRREEWEIEHFPDGEKREMVEIYENMGIEEKDAHTMVDILSKYKEAWINVMMVEELGIINENDSPVKNAVATFVAFACFGFIPLISYVSTYLLPLPAADPSFSFYTAAMLTASSLFALGAIKVKFTGKNWLRSGLETLIVGGFAALAAYAVGYLLSGLAL
ncbi:MAG: VIT1/CCC1 transporter family protein [Candidatus Ranarchaeia archaeon]